MTFYENYLVSTLNSNKITSFSTSTFSESPKILIKCPNGYKLFSDHSSIVIRIFFPFNSSSFLGFINTFGYLPSTKFITPKPSIDSDNSPLKSLKSLFKIPFIFPVGIKFGLFCKYNCWFF